MNRKVKTCHTPGQVLRFERGGRASNRPAPHQAGQQHQKQAGGDPQQQIVRYQKRVRERGDSPADQVVNIVDYVTESWAEAQRIRGMHACLKADAETLAQVYWLLSGKEGSERQA